MNWAECVLREQQLVVSERACLLLQPPPSSYCCEIHFPRGGGYHLKAEVWFIQLPPPTVSVCMLCDGDVCRCMCALKGESALDF